MAAFTECVHLFVVVLSDERCRAIQALFGDRWGADFHTYIVEDNEFPATARELFPEEQGLMVASWIFRSELAVVYFWSHIGCNE
jgi:hypothetical protein